MTLSLNSQKCNVTVKFTAFYGCLINCGHTPTPLLRRLDPRQDSNKKWPFAFQPIVSREGYLVSVSKVRS